MPVALANAGPENLSASYDDVIAKAEKLAKRAYSESNNGLSNFWKNMSVEQFSKIYYNPQKPLWNDNGPYQLQFFHPGGPYFHDTVSINLQDDGKQVNQKIESGMFWYEGEQPQKNDLENLDFAGFRVHHQLNSEYYDELISFLGSNYFRVLGMGQQYGLSIRGLAIDTAEPTGEEFPIFKEFWIEKPATNSAEEANSIVIMALLDSPSVTGAYRFTVHPGQNTIVDVEVSLFARKNIKKLGLAPLTSMFLFGENTKGLDDYRSEVHDSDGLMVQTSSGEWIWRPLTRRKNLTISSFVDKGSKGFGLSQRDRSFMHYDDLESRYQLRPSIWIEPNEDWGDGHIELVEIPSNLETTDNVVSYWVSDKQLKAGSSLQYGYRLTSYIKSEQWPPAGKTFSTREGPANRAGFAYGHPADARFFVVEFDSPKLKSIAADSPVEAIFTCASGKVYNVKALKNPENNLWRAEFNLEPNNDQPCDLRGFLKLGNETLTETWTYLYTTKYA
ncbi:glucan biosynthesis protein [Kiloniella sp.]|uniref:glucan biosynthesis protein n=1 Tax=Kiloniella sp. TaxID=1938587 RepID=UPI003B016353